MALEINENAPSAARWARRGRSLWWGLPLREIPASTRRPSQLLELAAAELVLSVVRDLNPVQEARELTCPNRVTQL
ncbi:MAG: hypothetical protein ACJAZN_000442, partial [Planctomycetota bacterium]